MSGNEITPDAAKEVVKLLRALPEIELLRIGVNCFGSQYDQFTQFAEPFGFIDVGTESDDQGSLSDIDEFEQLPQLSELEVTQNNSNFSDDIQNLSHSSLSFAGHQLKLDSIADGEKIADKIYDCPRMEVFELRGNTLGVDATKPIAEALKSQSHLKRVLWSDMFTGRLKEEIPKTLKSLCDAMTISGARITELDLSDNAIGPMAVPGIRDFLANETSFALQVLKLNNCGLGIAGKTIAECLIECHQKSIIQGTPLKLRTFIAGRNRLEYISTIALAEAFKIIGTLEEIAMPQNGIRAEGIIELSKTIRENPGLKSLNLGDNTFGESGASAMANALEHLSRLELVDFSDCLCRDRGSVLIARGLFNSKSPLKELNMSGNEITPDAAKEVVKLLRAVPGIELLRIGVNCFGSQYDHFTQFAEPFGFIDVGTESDDQGSLSDASQD